MAISRWDAELLIDGSPRIESFIVAIVKIFERPPNRSFLKKTCPDVTWDSPNFTNQILSGIEEGEIVESSAPKLKLCSRRRSLSCQPPQAQASRRAASRL